MPARLLQWRRVKKAVRSFAKRNRQRLLEWREALLPTEETFHLLLAAFVGVMAGAMNFLFYHATEGLKWALFGRGGDPVLLAEHLSRWARLLAPCLGGAAAGWLLQWGRRVFPTNRSTNLLEVVIAGDGRLPFRATLTKALSSLASIATGASIGREGSIVQLSALSASQAGQLARWPPYRLRLLVACGAAAGIASAYNAPIAGAVFAAQIILGTFAMSLFAPLLCASVAATMVSRSLFGIEALYQVPQVEFTRLFQLPWFFALGAAAGAAGAGFLKLMDLSRRAFDKTPLPLWARLAAAGALVGLIGLRFPEVWGNGYLATSRILIGYELYT
ncbi:MAG: chloride channel protein, partial [Verrucomicrobia bacterium]|nr:chloride channel protein [Verrucomicrobiota bacterium]